MKPSRRGFIVQFGQAWNTFWFATTAERTVTAMRVVTSVLAIGWLLALTPLVRDWLTGPAWLSIEAMREWRSGDPLLGNGLYISFWNWVDHPAAVYLLHAVSLGVLCLATLGVGGRWTMAAACWVIVSYVQRLQVVTGAFEYLLACWSAYLVVAPGRGWPYALWGSSVSGPLWLSGLTKRLLQVHLSMLYVAMALSKLAAEVWWNGEAVWWMIGQAETPLIDWTTLSGAGYLLNVWTHWIIVFELAMGILIWVPLWRGPLRWCSLAHWFLLGLVTGQIGLAALMALSGWVLWREEDSNCRPAGFAYIL
jgi:hypothetical protein